MRKVFWTHSYGDLKTLVRLRMQYELANANQTHESLRLVAAEIFGGGTSQVSEEEKFPETVDDIASIIASVGGMRM